MERVGARFIAAAIGVALVGFSVRGIRWWLMLRRVASPSPNLAVVLRVFFVSFSINNVAPLRLGDVFRAVAFTKQLHCDAWRVLGTLVTERTLDLLVFCAIGLVVTGWLPSSALPLRLSMALRGSIVILSLILLTFFLLNGTLRAALANKAIVSLCIGRSFLERTRLGIMSVLESIAQSSSPRSLPLLAFLSIAGWACEGMVFVAILAAVRPSTPPLAAFLGFGFGTVASLLPGLPGNFGAYEFFAVRGLFASGVDFVSATAIALVSHLIIWAPVTAIGIVLFATEGLTENCAEFRRLFNR
jgi:glycosyltransferase 2 family protein